MNISDKGLNLIKMFEGFRNEAYLDGGGIPTIGYGTILYPDGKKVKLGDICTEGEATSWLDHDVQAAVKKVNELHFAIPLNQNQFDAIVSFHYNTGALYNPDACTLYKKASLNPNDRTIFKYNKENPLDTCEFTRWCRDSVNGHKMVINGLLKRRMKEADLYSLTQ